MGKDADQQPRSLSSLELGAVARALELRWLEDSIVKGSWWPGVEQGERNYRLTMWSSRGARQPALSTWLVQKCGSAYRLKCRPATSDEIEMMLEALREVDALEQSLEADIAEAEYDCGRGRYQLCFTAFEDMLEGLPYKRWIFRRHRDGRPLSVGYVCETRRGDDYVTLPGGAILRGSPWSD
jgi:hypothetical protein